MAGFEGTNESKKEYVRLTGEGLRKEMMGYGRGKRGYTDDRERTVNNTLAQTAHVESI